MNYEKLRTQFQNIYNDLKKKGYHIDISDKKGLSTLSLAADPLTITIVGSAGEDYDDYFNLDIDIKLPNSRYSYRASEYSMEKLSFEMSLLADIVHSLVAGKYRTVQQKGWLRKREYLELHTDTQVLSFLKYT